MTTPRLQGEAGIPQFVHIALTDSAVDLAEVIGLLHSAEDIDWVSDVANLYLTHLNRFRQLVVSIGTRIDLADIAVRALARAS